MTDRPPHAFSLPLGEGMALRLRENQHVAEIEHLAHGHPGGVVASRPSFAPASTEELAARTGLALDRFARGLGWEADIWMGGAPIGALRAGWRSGRGGSAEIEYWLAGGPGAGPLAAAVVKGATHCLLEERGSSRVCLLLPAHDKAAARTAAEAGYELEAVRRSAEPAPEGRLDLAVYGRLGAEARAPAELDAYGLTRSRFCLVVDDELQLALPELPDARALAALVERNRQPLLPWLPWAEHVSEEAQREFIASRALAAVRDGDGFEAMILERGVLVGMFGVHSVNVRTRTAELGYWLDSRRGGNGIVTRVARAVLARCFGSGACVGEPFERIEIRADVGNLPSRAVAERLGFGFEGVLRRDQRATGGGYADMALYGLLRDEWVASQSPRRA